ncbi:hypothetical protein BDN72DRAFT_863165 [Pluteus cervinus]|uniref:Uncharacterized protein n=1 Tax=Pluteus cervinus TaxID=181527 RepID=A0ACD3A8T7_9AGAR|nr:hypothetical protein BDN72DRAFT_863165 [Pluteus cervinus]
MGLTPSTPVCDLPGAFDVPHVPLHQVLPLDRVDASDPSVIPAVPANIFEAGSADLALVLVDQWLAGSLERSKEAEHAILRAMAARLKEALREKFALKASIEPLEERFNEARKEVICSTCKKVAVLPYMLPCSHFRDILTRRIDESTAVAADGKTLREFLDKYHKTETNFQLALQKCGLGDDMDFTTYPSPCCGKSVSSKPLLAYNLKSICNSLRVNHDMVEPEEPKFECLFLQRT